MLKNAVLECLGEDAKGNCPDTKYGPIQRWDVSHVTNMSALFHAKNRQPFNTDISQWDVSSVVDMSNMFNGLSFFNQNISGWDVSRVTNMHGMFYKGLSFNANISHWDVSRVTDMSFMFYLTTSFKADISEWKVDRVTNMASMFEQSRSFNADISRWKVSRVENMSKMFYKTDKFNVDISDWDVSRVKDMTLMFYKAEEFSQELCGHWITSKARGRTTMFTKSKATLCPPKEHSGSTLDTPVIIGLSVSIPLVFGIVVVGMIALCIHLRSKNQDKNPPGAGQNAMNVVPTTLDANFGQQFMTQNGQNIQLSHPLQYSSLSSDQMVAINNSLASQARWYVGSDGKPVPVAANNAASFALNGNMPSSSSTDSSPNTSFVSQSSQKNSSFVSHTSQMNNSFGSQNTWAAGTNGNFVGQVPSSAAVAPTNGALLSPMHEDPNNMMPMARFIKPTYEMLAAPGTDGGTAADATIATSTDAAVTGIEIIRLIILRFLIRIPYTRSQYSHTRAHMCIYTGTHARTYKYTHTHKNTLTCTHTHTTQQLLVTASRPLPTELPT